MCHRLYIIDFISTGAYNVEPKEFLYVGQSHASHHYGVNSVVSYSGRTDYSPNRSQPLVVPAFLCPTYQLDCFVDFCLHSMARDRQSLVKRDSAKGHRGKEMPRRERLQRHRKGKEIRSDRRLSELRRKRFYRHSHFALTIQKGDFWRRDGQCHVD